MAVYSESNLTDLGWECPHTGTAIPCIDGMDNTSPGQCFRHRGVVGYPDGPIAFQDEVPGVSVITITEILPSGAAALTEEQFLARLASGYGWPEGTYMGEDGRPHGPAKVVIDSALYQE